MTNGRTSLHAIPRQQPRRQQRGVVLFVALIVLVVMTLAGVALLRQMGSGISIAGNIAFKENATSVADRGVEEARQWFLANAGILSQDAGANGYHSSWDPSFDPTTFVWSAANSRETAADAGSTGNTTRFIIHRLCAVPNLAANDPAQRCSDTIANNAGGSHGGASYSSVPTTASASPFYRVTTRVTGPRNTVSYTQVLMN